MYGAFRISICYKVRLTFLSADKTRTFAAIQEMLLETITDGTHTDIPHAAPVRIRIKHRSAKLLSNRISNYRKVWRAKKKPRRHNQK